MIETPAAQWPYFLYALEQVSNIDSYSSEKKTQFYYCSNVVWACAEIQQDHSETVGAAGSSEARLLVLLCSGLCSRTRVWICLHVHNRSVMIRIKAPSDQSKQTLRLRWDFFFFALGLMENNIWILTQIIFSQQASNICNDLKFEHYADMSADIICKWFHVITTGRRYENDGGAQMTVGKFSSSLHSWNPLQGDFKLPSF